GIPFKRDRYLKPHITEGLLLRLFGQGIETVTKKFLQKKASGEYRLKAEFTTQRQGEQYFSEWAPKKSNQKLKEAMFDLISNVLLIEPEGSTGEQFHFRFGIENTSSFQSLDRETQARLSDLYVDYFYRRQDGFWMEQAMQKLPVLKRVTN